MGRLDKIGVLCENAWVFLIFGFGMQSESSSQSFSFPSMEQDMLAFWDKHDTFQQSLKQTQHKTPYIFYDGPPFATGLPHHGHLLASTIKDIIGRYQTMQGHYVARRFGWDCHGLPVEYEIDKQLGQSTQEAVASLGIAGYNNACRGIVQRYVDQWYKTVKRLGRWVDFDNDYKTMDVDFMESVWWVFQSLWQKGLIYQGVKVVPFSTALGTGLSNFEASSNYQMLQDPAVTVLLKVVDRPLYLSIWTTTPWTLPANLGVCVHPDLTYVQVHDAARQIDWLVLEARLEAYQARHTLEVVKTWQGHELVGWRYEPIFPYFAAQAEEGAFQVFADTYVTTEDGTGLVHMAPAHGEDDHRIMQAAGVNAMVCPIDNRGCYDDTVTDFAGQHVKEADKHIIQHLKDSGQLIQHDTLDHSYPCCPRSDTPLIYRAMPSWFVKVEAIKDKMLAANAEIHWVPGHIQHGRFGKWLENARDWAVSRNRVWGTPLPIWINDETGAQVCIGSRAELEALCGQAVEDLHRDVVDDLTFTKPDEPGVYRRIPEVLDCWFESGAMPYAQAHYPFENKADFEKHFPAQFIAEGLDQTRGWFYTLTVLAAALFDSPAFENIIVQGIVLAEDGKKMSKRLKNYTAPDVLMDEYGADALRLYLIHSGLVKAEEQRFSDAGVKDMTRRVLLPWYNAMKFWQTYAEVDGWRITQHRVDSDHILDRWILSRLQTLQATMQQHMRDYALYHVVPELFDFIEVLTNGYIRLNRQRFWGEGLDQDKCAAYTTLYDVLLTLSQCMAPFAPFLSEYIYQQLDAKVLTQHDSVHLCDFPQAQHALQQPTLEAAVARMMRVILLGRQQRNAVKIKVKTPLQQVRIIHQDQALLDEMAKLSDTIARELNVKEVVFDANEDQYIRLYAKPNAPVLGKRFGGRFKAIKQAIEALDVAALRALEDTGHITVLDEKLALRDVLIFREAASASNVVTDRWISIVLETEVTPALQQEGLAREIINRIQKTRKDLGFHVSDRIAVAFVADAPLVAAIEAHEAFVSRETLAVQVVAHAQLDNAVSYEIDGLSIALQLTQVAHAGHIEGD